MAAKANPFSFFGSSGAATAATGSKLSIVDDDDIDETAFPASGNGTKAPASAAPSAKQSGPKQLSIFDEEDEDEDDIFKTKVKPAPAGAAKKGKEENPLSFFSFASDPPKTTASASKTAATPPIVVAEAEDDDDDFDDDFATSPPQKAPPGTDSSPCLRALFSFCFLRVARRREFLDGYPIPLFNSLTISSQLGPQRPRQTVPPSAAPKPREVDDDDDFDDDVDVSHPDSTVSTSSELGSDALASLQRDYEAMKARALKAESHLSKAKDTLRRVQEKERSVRLTAGRQSIFLMLRI